jgi:hypothetical protein
VVTPFEHILVLLSIVIGFAITTLLGGIVRLVHRRADVVWYWPSVVWFLIMLLLDVQIWWSRFGWRHVQTWTFAAFFAMMLLPIGAFALSALLVAEPDEKPLDMRKEYFARRQVFFGILIATVAASYLPDLMIGGNLGSPTDAAAKACIIAINIPPLLSANETLHKVVTGVGLVIICAYIGVLFAQL